MVGHEESAARWKDGLGASGNFPTNLERTRRRQATVVLTLVSDYSERCSGSGELYRRLVRDWASFSCVSCFFVCCGTCAHFFLYQSLFSRQAFVRDLCSLF